ncbi:MAG TPA: Ig-like domain-containing protein [Candidatus Angelobacter sp.]|jgi:hypothetical protein|nr:Ig-like domain-containing protein [Candidatus Angelobacter sp.]
MDKVRSLSAVLWLLSLSSSIWCQETKSEPKSEPPAALEILPKVIEVHDGDQLKLTAVTKDASGKQVNANPVTWFASPMGAVFIDQAGVANFYFPGRATIGAVVSGKVTYLHINVLPAAAARIEIDPPGRPVSVGGVLKLVATPRTEKGEPQRDQPVEWTSQNPSLATVDSAGVVTGVAPGSAEIQAKSGTSAGKVVVKIIPDPVQKLQIEPKSSKARTGDVIRFTAAAVDAKTIAIKNPAIVWSLSGAGAAIYPDGAFVAEEPGTYLITASSGQHQATASVVVTARNVEREIEVVSHISLPGEQAAEEWIVGNHAYLATIADHLNVYDIADPANPKLLDSLKVDARLINDVSTTPDERIGVITREGASSRKNGIVFVDTSDAAHLNVISEYTATVTGGVHSAFVDGHYVYLTDDATGSLRVIDFQDVKNPKEVARFEVSGRNQGAAAAPDSEEAAQGRYLHDLQVKDGLAYLCYWKDGLVILDVGNGMKGGSPEHPQVVSRFFWNHHELYGDGWESGTHSAFRYKNYLFVGDEVLPIGMAILSHERIPTKAILHVLDVTDIEHPVQVATYQVPEGGSHNFWVADDILYEGYYQGGARVLDVSGELRGDLYRQGREIARLWTGDSKGYRPNLPMTWGGQPCSLKCSSDLLNGLIYFNDINSGLWIVRLGKPKYRGSTFAAPTRDVNGVPR